MSAPIFQFQEKRDALIQEVIDRAFQQGIAERELTLLLNDAAYQELTRLENNGKSQNIQFWQSVYRSLKKSSRQEQEKQLYALIKDYVCDVVGRFDPKVYRFATNVAPLLLSFILDPQLKSTRRSFDEKITIEGPLSHIQALAENGTLILVPTHSSNLDSIAIGWALYRSKLPPFTYGAGKNLFTNRLLSFFMHNLGAYRVDRRLKHQLYKDVLKMYSLVILEHGFHSLFFPGGTRSRTGMIEQHLKLGLLGTGIEAYVNNLKNHKTQPGLYIVPCTMNYHLVLEAETLIDDYLKATGKSRYIIEDDESARILKILGYVRKTLDLDTSLCLRFCQPIDLFGNQVDEQGQSYDRQGRLINTRDYVTNHLDEVVHDRQRDTEYTRELGQYISSVYLKNNVILSTNLVSYVLFRYLVYLNPHLDLYHLIRLGVQEAHIEKKQLLAILDRFKVFLMEQENENTLRVGTPVKQKSTELILEEAVQYLQMFYSRPTVLLMEDNIHVQDMKLLFYYHNRLKGYGFERHFADHFIVPALITL